MRVRAAFAAAGVVSLTLSVAAHHSHGQYDETFQDIEGVVKELHLLTPHSWLYIEVKDAKGVPQLWALEARPVTATTSKLVYTLVYDNSTLGDDAAKEKDRQTRTATFTRALQNMKTIAEGGTLPPPPPRAGGPGK